MNKPEPWEIVRDKLLGVEIYSDELTFEIIFHYLAKNFTETGLHKEKLYVSRKGYNYLSDNELITFKRGPRERGFSTFKFYGYSGMTEIIPL